MGGLRAGTIEIAAEQATAAGVGGVVLASCPGAAVIGVEAMRNGGNAFDGAVAAALAETVLLPPKCGLGGDLIALCLTPGTTTPKALIAIGGAPEKLGEAVERQGRLPRTGPLSVGVPGAPSGYTELAALGRLSLQQLVQPAIDLARNGFPWAQVCTFLGRESANLVARHNQAGLRYFPDGQPPEPRTRVRLPGLADLLERFAADGADLFHGDLGEAIVAYVGERGGIVTTSDLTEFGNAEWTQPAQGRMAERTIWTTPLPTHGPSLIDAMTEARSEDQPADVLRRVLAAIDRRSNTGGGTSMISAADAEGSVVTLIHSNSFPRFGSGLVVPQYDLVLNNRAGRGFTGEIGHPNFPRPGQRPLTTLHAWAVSRADSKEVEMMGATPGGENQMPWNAQMLSQVVSGIDDPGTLVVSPRWELMPDMSLRVEEGFDPSEVDELASVAPVQNLPRWAMGCAQQVIRTSPVEGVLVGASDPRTGGCALPV